jgi:hypothetical protein
VDPHGGRFSPEGARNREGECLACHGMDSFRPSRFDATMHDSATFRLRGAHRAIPCVACHAELGVRVASVDAVLLLKNDARACRDCHKTAHGIQFDSRKDGGACESCHDQERFVPASGFDHATVKVFPLDGKHRNVACVKCHPVVTTQDGKKMSLYKPVSAKCESCHAAGELLQQRN